MKTRLTEHTMGNGQHSWSVDLNNADYKGDPMFTLRCWFRSKAPAETFSEACKSLQIIGYTDEAWKVAKGTISRNLPHIIAGHNY